MDKDLTFLFNASEDDLKRLCDIITHDLNGYLRVTEELTITDIYQRNYPHRIKLLLESMIFEYRLYGDNTYINFFRGEGPSYREILIEVGEYLNIYWKPGKLTLENMEDILCRNLFRHIIHNRSKKDVSIFKKFEIKTENYNNRVLFKYITSLWENGKFEDNILLSLLKDREYDERIFCGDDGEYTIPKTRVLIPATVQIIYIKKRLYFNKQ